MYALGGADASAFSIDTMTGEVTFVASPDYEPKSSYDFTVTATDGTDSSTQSVTVNVNDVRRPPRRLLRRPRRVDWFLILRASLTMVTVPLR